jgi:hypothetical protein
VRAVVQDLVAAGLHGAAQGLPGRVLGARLGLGPLVRSASRSQGELEQTGLVTDLDTDYQLGMPEVRSPRSRARRDLGVSDGDIATSLSALVGGVRVGKYSPAAAASTCASACWPISGAPGGSRPHARPRPVGELVPLTSLVTYRDARCCRAITARIASAPSRISGNVASATRRTEALAKVERSKTLPPRLSRRARRPGLAFLDSMSVASSSRWCSESSSPYMVLASSSTPSSTR